MENHIFIFFLDGSERQYPKQYNTIMNELKKQDDKIWYLFESQVGEYITETKLNSCSKLIAVRRSEIPEIPKIYNSQLQVEILQIENDKVKRENTDLKTKIQAFQKIYPTKLQQESEQLDQIEKLRDENGQIKAELEKTKQQLKKEQALLIQSNNEISIKFDKLCKQDSINEDQKKEIQLLSNENINYSNSVAEYQQKILQLSNENINYSNSVAEYQQKILQLSNENINYSNSVAKYQQEILQLSNQNLNYSNRVAQLSGEIEILQTQNNQQSNKLVEQSQQLEILKQNNQKSLEKLANLESQSQNLQNELQQSKTELLRLQSQKIINQKSQEFQTPTNETVFELNKFYTDEQKQECVERIQMNNSNQIRYLDNLIQKLCDEKKEDEQTMNKNVESIIFKNQLDIYLITLDKQQFIQSIKNKNFFFRKNCLIKKEVSLIQQKSFNNQNTQFNITMNNGQNINIKNLYIKQSEYQAQNIIFNMLLVESYLKLFEDDLIKTKTQSLQFEKWKLKIPRQFLITDNIGNCYIYQECLGINTKQFTPFKETQSVDQYISSFFKYFYISTNKNFAITECELVEQEIDNQQREVVIQGIVIHSNYAKVFSVLDEGKNKIQEFDNSSQVPPGTIQKYWSDQLQNFAQKNWYDQQN